MKSKRIIAGITSAVMAFSISAVSLTACKKGCEHVYNWNVTTPPTCTTEGTQDGLCGICGDVITESIPVDENAHSYGNWAVNPEPTQTAEGKATKTCSYNQSHKLEVTLPALTDEKYEILSETLPTALKDGETTYSYPHDSGAVQFTVKTPARNIQSVADAVEVGVSNITQIVKSAGRTNLNTLDEYSGFGSFYYEFGEDYTHIINDVDGSELYCSDDEEEDFFAVQINGVAYTYDSNGYPVNKTSQGSTPVRNVSLDPQYLNGMKLTLGYSGTPDFYGAEGLVSDLYDIAAMNSNRDLSEKFTLNPDGTVSCEFSFGYFADSSLRLSIIKVEFTLTETLAIGEVRVTADIYGNKRVNGEEVGDMEEIILPGRPDPIEVTVKAWEYADGVYRLRNGQDGYPSGRTVIEIKQATETGLGIKRADLPENLYQKDFQYVESFNVKYNGNILGEDDVVQIRSRVLYYFDIVDVKNKGEGISNLSLDPVTCYLRRGNTDIQLDAGTKDNKDIRVSAYTSDNNQVTVNSMYTGLITIVLKTNSGSFEKELQLECQPQAPSSIPPEVNVYNSKGEIGWRRIVGGEKITLYSGQPLEFKAGLTTEEESFCDPSFTARIYQYNGKSAIPSSVIYNLTDPGYETMTFTGTTTGTYVIRLESALNPTIRSNLTVEVIDTPTLDGLFGINYFVQLEYPEVGRATVIFSTPVETDETAFAGTVYTGTVTITLNEMSETLTYYYAEGGINEDTQQRQPCTFATVHKDGAEDLAFSLTINDGFFFVLQHPTEFGDDETAVLEPEQN